jgi:hypothetical protein
MALATPRTPLELARLPLEALPLRRLPRRSVRGIAACELLARRRLVALLVALVALVAAVLEPLVPRPVLLMLVPRPLLLVRLPVLRRRAVVLPRRRRRQGGGRRRVAGGVTRRVPGAVPGRVARGVADRVAGHVAGHVAVGGGRRSVACALARRARRAAELRAGVGRTGTRRRGGRRAGDHLGRHGGRGAVGGIATAPAPARPLRARARGRRVVAAGPVARRGAGLATRRVGGSRGGGRRGRRGRRGRDERRGRGRDRYLGRAVGAGDHLGGHRRAWAPGAATRPDRGIVAVGRGVAAGRGRRALGRGGRGRLIVAVRVEIRGVSGLLAGRSLGAAPDGATFGHATMFERGRDRATPRPGTAEGSPAGYGDGTPPRLTTGGRRGRRADAAARGTRRRGTAAHGGDAVRRRGDGAGPRGPATTDVAAALGAGAARATTCGSSGLRTDGTLRARVACRGAAGA